MSACDIEKSEKYIPVNLSTAENEKANENFKDWFYKTALWKNRYKYVWLGLSLVHLILAICVLAVAAKRSRKPCPALPMCPVVSCPDGWVGYQRKCYYFANPERNWTSSKMDCTFVNASLAVIDSQAEMDFMMRYKASADHWIGLLRNLSQPWKWVNGTTFNNWFTILGGGNCAYMNHEGIASSKCSREQPWICSKLAMT